MAVHIRNQLAHLYGRTSAIYDNDELVAVGADLF